MSNSLLSDNELNELRKLLPHGSMSKIAGATGIHRNNVKQILKGKWYNADVLTEALRMAEEEKKKRAKLADKIKATIA